MPTQTSLFVAACALRIVLLAYGAWQDGSPIKYTDIDYFVFTDAARFVSRGLSPYARDTYRYTPLLSWLLLPTTRVFASGKVLFALSDLVAGWIMVHLLRRRGFSPSYAALWLCNPMVATISTRGSAEGLLGALAMALLWAVEHGNLGLAGFWLGLGVHLKIYPFIWAPAIALSLPTTRLLSPPRVKLAVVSFVTFTGLNTLMYIIYGTPFLHHTFLHHLSRLDHRHNFSPYNTLLYLRSAQTSSPGLRAESLAFLPQLLLSCVLIPLVLAKKDLATCMMAQTFAFVTFNKVCTSQYFLWYMVFLPLYLPKSTMLRRPAVGVSALLLWVAAQAAWLQQGYQLEFLGRSTFFPGLWLSSLLFFLVNCWILGIIISDGGASPPPPSVYRTDIVAALDSKGRGTQDTHEKNMEMCH